MFLLVGVILKKILTKDASKKQNNSYKILLVKTFVAKKLETVGSLFFQNT